MNLFKKLGKMYVNMNRGISQLELLWFSLLFIFLKTNLFFIDLGAFYYITSLLGFLLLYVSVRKLQNVSNHFQKIKVPTIIMVIISAFFAVLNGTGNHLNTFSVNTLFEKTTGYSIMAIAVIGIAITFYITYLVVRAMKDIVGIQNTKVKLLDRFWELIVFTFIIAMIIPTVPLIMGVHLLSTAAFLVMLFIVMDKNKETIGLENI